MAIGSLSAISRFCKRYWIVIFFPTFTAGSIFLDISHTRKWKWQQAELQATAELDKILS
jgi:hypothetical protein